MPKRKAQRLISELHDSAKQKTVGAGLADFARRYDLSIRKLSAICGGSGYLSKSSADRLIRGVAEIRFFQRVKPLIVEGITRFLSGLGKTHDEIQVELKSIFSEEIAPMIAHRKSLPVEVQQYFHLRLDPFALESDPRTAEEVFACAPLNAVLNRVSDAVNYQGFLAVIGEIGSGKSTLKKRLMSMAAESKGKLHLLWPEFAETECVRSGAIVRFILESFGQKPRQGLVASQRQLTLHLSHLHEQGVRVALGFDECHRLNDTTLIALKNFYELGTGGFEKYLGIILFGQPKFVNDRMQSYDFREIAERLDIIHMPKLAKQAGDYMAHRIRLAGGDVDKLFDRAAITALAAQASTPLALGNLANAALIKAHQLAEKKVLASFINKPGSEPSVLAVRRVG